MSEIIISKEEVINLNITHLRAMSRNSNDWQKPGISEYQLYAYLSTKFNDSIILDIGTRYGGSALALSFNESNHVRSYDIEEQGASYIKKDNVTWHIGQFTEDKRIDWDNVSIVMLDVGVHTGKEEREMMQWLRDREWKGILLHDDIGPMWSDNQDMWNEIPEEKFDLSEIGHMSGTGLVNFGDVHKITIVE